MVSEKKEVINECLLVSYITDEDGKKLFICRSRDGKEPIMHIWHGDKVRDLYLDILELVSFGKISKEEIIE